MPVGHVGRDFRGPLPVGQHPMADLSGGAVAELLEELSRGWQSSETMGEWQWGRSLQSVPRGSCLFVSRGRVVCILQNPEAVTARLDCQEKRSRARGLAAAKALRGSNATWPP